MTTILAPSPSGLLEPQAEAKIGFDCSSLNRLSEDPDSLGMCARLARSRIAPVLSSLSIIEILKSRDDRPRDRLLASAAELRHVADYRLLPLPHEVIEAAFQAWLTAPTVLSLGGERTAEGMQNVLERPAARDPAWREVAWRFARAEQQSFRSRFKGLRLVAKQLRGTLPASSAQFIEGVLGARASMATVLNAWFPPAIHGQAPLTHDEAVACLFQVPTVRAYLVSLGLSAFKHAVQGRTTRNGAAGAIDISQAAYLPLTQLFVVDDTDMYEHCREVVRLASLSTVVVRYVDLRSMLAEEDSDPALGRRGTR